MSLRDDSLPGLRERVRDIEKEISDLRRMQDRLEADIQRRFGPQVWIYEPKEGE